MTVPLLCRLFGHQWGPWCQCLRPDLQIRACHRCPARQTREVL